ncbi:MAG: hypothetical protein HY870_12290 [Chloroflexi bacterium]|nr:hypothetical protein [Chloroflexota bacterium]
MTAPSSDIQPDAIVDSFRAAWQAKAALPPRPIATPAYRRRVGLLLGIAIAVMYGFVSQVINKLAMPDVPFSQHPIGLIGNLVIIVISGVAIGLVCAAPERSSNGVVRASAVVVLAVIAQALAAYAAFSDPLPPALVAAIGIGLLYITALPAMMLLRLAIDNQTEALDKPVWAWERIRIPLGILALVSVAGAFAIYPQHVQTGFVDLQALIQSGLAVRDPADLPSALSEENNVGGFLDFATADYTLEQSLDFDLRSDLTFEDEVGNAIIVARFKRGAILACAYSPTGDRLRCKSYLTAAFFQRTG